VLFAAGTSEILLLYLGSDPEHERGTTTFGYAQQHVRSSKASLRILPQRDNAFLHGGRHPAVRRPNRAVKGEEILL
jgi:hypothetical protein